MRWSISWRRLIATQRGTSCSVHDAHVSPRSSPLESSDSAASLPRVAGSASPALTARLMSTRHRRRSRRSRSRRSRSRSRGRGRGDHHHDSRCGGRGVGRHVHRRGRQGHARCRGAGRGAGRGGRRGGRVADDDPYPETDFDENDCLEGNHGKTVSAVAHGDELDQFDDDVEVRDAAQSQCGKFDDVEDDDVDQVEDDDADQVEDDVDAETRTRTPMMRTRTRTPMMRTRMPTPTSRIASRPAGRKHPPDVSPMVATAARATGMAATASRATTTDRTNGGSPRPSHGARHTVPGRT